MSERDHAHAHSSTTTGKSLLLALVLTLGFSVVELIAGWRSGSLALLADAGHMVTDAASLGMSALAAWLAARPPSRRHTYGLGRVEFLAALINALSMLAVVFVIGSEAWQRLQHPGSINGATVSVVAVLGLLINLVVAWILSRGERNLNVRAAMLHVMGDALGSVAAIAAGVVIWLTGWTPIDPLLSILIGGLILASSVGLLREALHATLDGVPFTMNIELVGQALAEVPGVSEVHDLHVWPIASERLALSAHVLVANLASWPQTLHLLRAVASDQGIDHVTFQPESPAGELQPIQFVRR
jgi:cobalt-zinc-cadmium efflux system protein